MNSPIRRTDQVSIAPSPAAVPEATLYLSKLEPAVIVAALLRRSWLIVLCVAAAVGAMWLYLSKVPPTYRAEGAVYVSTEAPQILDIRAVAPRESRDLEQMHSVEYGMMSSTLLLRVIKANELDFGADFADEPLTEQGLLEVLGKRVEVGLERGTRIINITVEDTDPARAKRLVESIKSEYEKWTVEQQEMLIDQVSQGLAREEKRLRARMEASAEKVQGFREQNPVPGLEGAVDGGSVGDELTILSSQLTAARAERLRLEAEFEAIEKLEPEDPQTMAGLSQSEHTDEVLGLLRQLREKQTEFARVKERYLHKHPVYIEVSNEVESLKKSVAGAAVTAGEALEKSYLVAKENEGKLEAEVLRARGSAVGVEGLRADFGTLTREAEADRELHASVARRLRETSLAASVPASVLRWEVNPLVPEKPSGPKKMVLFPLSAVAGMFLGLLLVGGVEMGDRRVRDAAAVARATGTPLLVRVPRASKASTGKMVLVEEPASEPAEAFRRLRAVLTPPPADHDLRTILFTSSRRGEGKSFCAMNHAASLAMQGHRTLLLDADLRSPGLSRDHLRQLGGDAGLGEYLAGRAQPADACFRTAVPKLCLLSSGEMKTDAAELLAGTRFPALLEDAYRWFDRVVIDVPGVLDTSDAQAIARYADQTCLVVGEETADRRELKRTVELLRSSGANLSGFIWNHAPARTTGCPDPVVAAVAHGIETAEVAVDA